MDSQSSPLVGENNFAFKRKLYIILRSNISSAFVSNRLYLITFSVI